MTKAAQRENTKLLIKNKYHERNQTRSGKYLDRQEVTSMVNSRYNTTRNFGMSRRYSSFSIFRTVKSRRLRRAGHVTRTGNRSDTLRNFSETTT
jgi:hypothetical protein